MERPLAAGDGGVNRHEFMKSQQKPLDFQCPHCAEVSEENRQLRERIDRMMSDIRPRARTTDPDTSHEAAARLDPTKGGLEVMEVLRRHPNGLTMQEVAELIPGRPELVCVSPRFAVLRKQGFIVDSGERKVSAETNRPRIVWRLA